LIEETRHYAQDLLKKGKPAYEIQSSVIVLITDGFQDPNLLDKDNGLRNMDPVDAAKFVKKLGIHLYIINVEPKMALSEFGPQRRVMQRAAELTGGRFYLVSGTTSLMQIYAEIDQLEKSKLPDYLQAISKEHLPQLYRRFSFYPYLIAIGMLTFFLSIILETLLVRRIP